MSSGSDKSITRLKHKNTDLQFIKQGNRYMHRINRRHMLSLFAATGAGAATGIGPALAKLSETGVLTASTARQTAREAYIYAYPLVKNYLSIYQFAMDKGGDQYKGPPNQVNNVARVFTPADTGVITPNSDTPYSFLILDLRAEPIVVTLPPIADDRYYSLQLVDLYTHNVDYLGTRVDGNEGGDFLLAGPDWDEQTPTGIGRVIRFSTGLAISQFRTQLFAPSDLDEVKRIQAGYRALPLSQWRGDRITPPQPETEWPPISDETFNQVFWDRAAFMLSFCPVLAHETDLRAKMARIGLAGSSEWQQNGLAPDIIAAIHEGGLEGHRDIEKTLSHVTSSTGLFGTPGEMAGKYLARAAGAMGGIYGNSIAETLYPSYTADAQGQPYDTARFNYQMRFPPGELPPVDAFWSVTMYDQNTRMLVENPLQRYLINSPMLDELLRDADGGITLYLQHESPGSDLEPNWLPAPDGPMGVVMRLYLPKPAALDGTWTAPPITTNGPAD